MNNTHRPMPFIRAGMPMLGTLLNLTIIMLKTVFLSEAQYIANMCGYDKKKNQSMVLKLLFVGEFRFRM